MGGCVVLVCCVCVLSWWFGECCGMNAVWLSGVESVWDARGTRIDTRHRHFCYSSELRLACLWEHYFGMPTNFSSVEMVSVCHEWVARNGQRILSWSDLVILDVL